MKPTSILILFILVSFLLVATAACNSGEKMGNMRGFIDEATPLDNLADVSRVIVFTATNSSDQGIYWLDLDNHKLHLAITPQAESKFRESEIYTWAPNIGWMVWAGNKLIYGSKVLGFFALESDGTTHHITDIDQGGRLAYDGESILRFKRCDPNETSVGYIITPIDRHVETPRFCLPRPSANKPFWYSVTPVWNPYLPQADFIIRKQRGGGNNRVVEEVQLVEVADDGELVEIMSLDTGFELSFDNNFQARPDGQAFYIRDSKLEQSTIIDRQGNLLVDFQAVEAQFPHLQRNGRFSWSPDSQKAILLFDDCHQNSNPCDQHLILASNNFQELTEIATLPPKFRFGDIIWSPDSTHVGFVKEIHQGADNPPRIYTINLTDQSVADYTFPGRFILRNVQWIR